jgi:hypothetical protein
MTQDRQIQFNRLLDYRPVEQLSRMQDDERAALLTELLGTEPSEASWQALIELFACWPDGVARDDSIGRADAALASWPDRLRFTYSGNRLLHEGGGLSALARLVRSIEIYRRQEHGSAELRAIASSEYLAGLTYLSIVHSDISARAWQALATSSHLGNLRHLHVSKSVLGPADFRCLAESCCLPQLQCLKLIDVGLRPGDLEGARQTIPFVELRAIDLSANALGNEGAALLSQAGWLQQIRRIVLRDNYIGAQGMLTLLSSEFCSGLEQIDLFGNRVSDLEKQELTALAAKRHIHLRV